MINWFSVAANGLWVLGLSILLAAFSFHYWAASVSSRRLSQQLKQDSFQRAIWLGLAFISFGLAGTSDRKWELIVWIILGLANLVNLMSTVPAIRQRLGR